MDRASERVAKVKMVLPILAEWISRGDGSFVVRPIVRGADLETWLTVRRAAEVLEMPATSVYPLKGVLLTYRKPLRSKVIISLKSTLRLRDAAKDPEFWECAGLQERVRKAVAEEMQELVKASLGI